MPRYQFTGHGVEVFPTIVTADGTLVCEPGDVVDIPEPVEHARLVEVTDGALATTTEATFANDAWFMSANDARVAEGLAELPPPTDPPSDPPADTPTSEV